MSYASEVAADTPLVWYKLDQAAGSGAPVDSSGNGFNGDNSFLGTYGVAGIVGTAVSLNGSNQGVRRTSGGLTAISNDAETVTVELWVKTTQTTEALLAQATAGAGLLDVRMGRTTAGKVSFRWNQISTSAYVEGSVAVNDGNWHHIVVAASGGGSGTARLYVDGTQIATQAATQDKTGTASAAIHHGINDSLGSDLTGSLDEIAWYAGELSAARVLAHYNAATAVDGSVALAGTMQAKTAAFAVGVVVAASLAGTLSPKTASFELSASAETTLAGTLQAKTASFALDIPAAPDRIVTLAGTLSSKTASFELLSGLDTTLAGSLRPKTAEFAVLGGADIALAGDLRPKTAAFVLAGAKSVALAGSLQAKTAAFALESGKTVTLAASLQRKTSAFAIASNPAIRIAATLRPKTAAFAVDAQTTATLAGTLRPKLATFTTYVVTPVTPSPVVGAQAVVVARAFGPVTMQGSQAAYTVSSAYTPKARQRILVDNVDWSFFRGAITPDVAYTLVEPYLYGPATLDLPQVSACFERPGYGDLTPLRPGANVEVQRVLDDVVVGTDYKGVIVAFDLSGRNLSVELGGEATGRAALRNRQVPIFPRVNDLGRQFADFITDLGLPHYPHFGPVTGIECMTSGGTGYLEWGQGNLAKAWTRAGKHWTTMPDEATGAYESHRKDDTTIHGTVFLDDAKTVANLRRDISEEPNRIYATGVTPAGQRVRFGVYPGLIQGPTPNFPGHMEEGATGDGVRLLIGKLHAMGYLKLTETGGGYDQDVVDAVTDLQIDAGLFDEGFVGTAVPGEVNETTWNALYDLGITDNSLEWAHIEPAAQRRKVRKWNRSGTGGIMGVNPLWESGHLVRDRNVEINGNRSQMREFSRTVLHDSDDANWVGDITFHTGALIRGDGFQGMTVDVGDVMDARELRPGMNLDLPQFDGGTLVHIAAIQVDDSGIVTATVDTRFRDAMEVWEVIARNKESRNDPARRRNQKHRSSTMVKDSIGEWDEIGGLLGQDIDLVPGWNVFEIVAAMEGTISRLRIILDDPDEFVCAVFGRSITADRLNNLIPDPLSTVGTKAWQTKRDELNDHWVLYSAGTRDQPCGYSPGVKSDNDDVTGKHDDDAGFAYRSESRTALHCAVFVAYENTISAQRIAWNQLESGA